MPEGLDKREKDTATGPEAGMSSRQRKFFDAAQRAARGVIRRRVRVLRLTRDAYLKLGSSEGAMARVAADLRAMLRLSRAWALREYTTVPWKVVLYILAAIVYFVNPIDLIPDVLTGIGFIDDAAVVGAVVRSIHAQLDDFRRWELERRGSNLEANGDEALSAAA